MKDQGLAMEERCDESFRFMEQLVATWLEGAHHTEIARVLDLIRAELSRRTQARSLGPWPWSA